jgi:GTP-binding protein Era
MPEITKVHRAGFVTIMGKPNVGKSTLINTLLEQKIAAVSSKPQTTRKRQLGILSLPDAQIIFQDTPGVHKALHKLGECMNQEALATIEDADLILFVVDASQPPNDEDEHLSGFMSHSNLPILLVLNKVDLIHNKISPYQESYQALVPTATPVSISATHRKSLDGLLEMITTRLPENPPYYDTDQVTDWYERDICADLIREAALNLLHHEVPHSIAIRIDEYAEREGGAVYIAATLFVERESQKPIVIGKGGEMLKEIGSTARRAIQTMNERRVYLELRVKVRENWRNKNNILKMFGYHIN